MHRGKHAFPALLLLLAGCGHKVTAPAPTPPPVAAPAPSASAFQPYALISQPPPTPKVVTHRFRVLHLARRNGAVFAADGLGHFYHVGRDRRGRIFPVYRDPATRAVYPLYYDSARDRLYRVARSDDGRYYRGYVDDPANRFYADDRDYERVTPGDADRPIVTDSYNTYNYNSYHDGVSPPRGRGTVSRRGHGTRRRRPVTAATRTTTGCGRSPW